MGVPGLISLPGTEAKQGQYIGSCQCLVSKVTDVSKWGWSGGGHRSPFSLSLCLFKVCFTHSSNLPASFSLPYLPIGLSSVMRVIVTVVSDQGGRKGQQEKFSVQGAQMDVDRVAFFFLLLPFSQAGSFKGQPRLWHIHRCSGASKWMYGESSCLLS